MKLKHRQLAESQPLLRRLSNQEPVVEAVEAKTFHQKVVTMLLARRPEDVAEDALMVVLKVPQRQSISKRGPMKKAKMVAEWAVVVVEVDVPRLPVKPRTKLRAMKRLKIEERLVPAVVAEARIVEATEVAGKTIRKVRTKTLGSISTTISKDHNMKR